MSATEYTTIDLLRHGACEGGEIFRGHIDVPLNEQGWLQMRQSLEFIGKPWPWERIISSPLERCRAFSNKLAIEATIPWREEPAFKEMSFGDWDGQPIDHIWRTYKEEANRFATDPAMTSPPNGESLGELQKRVLTGWHDMIEQYQGKHLLSIQHGGTIRVILAYILDMPLNSVGRLHLPYAGLCRIRVYPDNKKSPTLLFHNPLEA